LDNASNAAKLWVDAMTFIPYPDIPNYEGVPDIPRTSPGSPSINISIAPQQQEWVNQASGELPWGIFTLANAPIYTPTDGGTLSVLSFGFTRSMQVSDFPIEANNTNQGAAFASFNKVFQPSNPVVVLALSGTEGEKIAFLKAIDDACQSTDLFNVYTPDASYSGSDGACTIERYSYQRTATRGATMLIVEVSLKQILQITAALSNVANGTTAITSPQSPSALPTMNNGITQTSAAPNSWLAQIAGPNGTGTVGF
jgi:hypothetical protein